LSTIIPQSPGDSPFDHLKQVDAEGRDFWSARDLQLPSGYDRWEGFAASIERAIAACENSGANPKDHFRGATKKVTLGSSASRALIDWHLTRYAAYLVAMNGDPRKPEIAAAQTYFAVKTREAETAAPAPRELSNRELALMVIAEADRADAAEKRVAELEPKADAFDVIAAAKGDFSLRDAAFILNRDPAIQTGQNRLKRSLRAFGMVDGSGVPYAKHQTHLTERVRTYQHPRTGEHMLAAPQIRITVAGLRYLHKKLGGCAPLRFDQLPFAEGDAA
jgi:DNA-damage-inducible protein D